MNPVTIPADPNPSWNLPRPHAVEGDRLRLALGPEQEGDLDSLSRSNLRLTRARRRGLGLESLTTEKNLPMLEHIDIEPVDLR